MTAALKPPWPLRLTWWASIVLPLTAAGASVAIQDPRGIAVGSVGALLIAVPPIVPGLRRTPWLIRIVLAVMIGVQFPAEALLLYQRLPPVDKPIHFVETAAMALGLGLIARLILPPRWAGWGVLVTGCAALGLSAAWELLEFASDGWTGTALQVSNFDTMTDILADLAGAAAGSRLTGPLLQSSTGRFLAADFRRASQPTAEPAHSPGSGLPDILPGSRRAGSTEPGE